MRRISYVFRSFAALALAAPSLATSQAPSSPQMLADRLAANEAVEVVAEDAGCAGVDELEAFLVAEPTTFLRVIAPFDAADVGARPELVTPLRAEKRGLRATTPFSAFALTGGFFGGAGLGPTDPFAAGALSLSPWHASPLASPLMPPTFRSFDSRFGPSPW